MAEPESWYDIAEIFEGIDPDGDLSLEWFFDSANNDYAFQLQWPHTAPFNLKQGQASEEHRRMAVAKFKACSARASRRLGFPDPLRFWYIEIRKISPGDDGAPITGRDPITGASIELRAGWIRRVCQKAAELCYKIESGQHKPLIASIPNEAEPDQSRKRKDLVETFIRECNSISPERIYKRHIWRLAGHTKGRQFERWQNYEKTATKSDERNFSRILNETPGEFIAQLKSKNILADKR